MKNYLVNLKTIGLLISALFSAAIIAGCDYYGIPSEVRKSLKAAGDNKSELMAVIDHFRHDSEKLEAAYYLISNMPGHYSIEGNSVFDPAFDQIKPFLEKTGRTPENGEIFTSLIDSIRQINPPSLSIREDVKTINSDFLIQNIDLAFAAYYSIPAHLRCDWDTFLRFVLPYRIHHEPVESGLREFFLIKYNWAFDRMIQTGSFQNVICDLLDSIDIRWERSYSYPSPLPLSNIYKTGIANTCDLMVITTAFIYRSLGIPAAFDFTPHMGNSYWSGHSWIVFLLQDTFYAVDLPTRKIMNTLYEHETIPKIYRRSFETNITNSFLPISFDVTDQYRNTIDVQFKLESPVNKAQLMLFHKDGLKPVAESIYNNKREISFNEIGKSVVYFINDATDDRLNIINPPFYVNRNGEIIYLIPDYKNQVTAYLTRKFPPYVLRELDEIHWINSINGAEIQASNKVDFSDAVTLLKINNFKSCHKQIITTGNRSEYRNYRLVGSGSSEIHLAEFHLLKNDTIIMTDWQVFSTKDQYLHTNGYNLVDNNPLTYISDNYLSVHYYFDEPVAISDFQIQARNRANGVYPGIHYELMFWDQGWISAGSKHANDTLLVYDNLPSGALFWLQNLEGGRHEQIFLLDDKGYQYWPGVTSFNVSYHEFFELERLCNN